MAQGNIELNIETLRELEHLYNTAIAEGMDMFMYRGMKLLTIYAKYLIQYGHIILQQKHWEALQN